MVELAPAEARRIAVAAQLLAEEQPHGLVGTVRHLGRLQMDPTSAVARAERLVLFSRLGPYDVDDLARALYEDGTLFEYWAFIVPTSDYAIHRATMRRYPSGERARPAYVRRWLADNASFRRYVLRELRRRGPLLSRDLEDRAVVPWTTGGWNDGKNLPRMLEILWFTGDVAVVGREGVERRWDLAARRYPTDDARLPPAAVARALLDRQLAALGVATAGQIGWAFDGRPPGWERALRGLVRDGVAVPVRIAGVPGEWYANAAALERPFRPRTTLLAPFDRLVYDRERTLALFDFRYRLEIYVPKAKREHGYYVLPILHGDRLIGRIDPLLDRRTGVLAVHAVYAEPSAPAEAGPAVATAIEELAAWLGATRIDYGAPIAPAWAASLRSSV